MDAAIVLHLDASDLLLSDCLFLQRYRRDLRIPARDDNGWNRDHAGPDRHEVCEGQEEQEGTSKAGSEPGKEEGLMVYSYLQLNIVSTGYWEG